jgi:NAD+--dinitrogen-reductase ADP-D-ribosyltransferase
MNEPSPRRGRGRDWAGEDRAPSPAAGTDQLVGLPVGLLGSTAFNAHPQPLAIAGVRKPTAACSGSLKGRRPGRRVSGVPALHGDRLRHCPPEPGTRSTPRARHRSSYLKLLQGWGWTPTPPPAPC